MTSIYITYYHEFIHYLPRLISATLTFAVFWFAGNAVAKLARRSPRILAAEGDLGEVLAVVIQAGFFLLGTVSALGTAGLDVSALVAGLGLGGLAVGVALKDLVSNALSGFLILIYRPFHTGSRILVAGSKGEVREVNLRYTVIEDEHGTRAMIPNSKIFTEVITLDPPP